MATVASKLLTGLTSITAESVGKKVGLALVSDLFTEPAEFFLKEGLEALFGSAELDEFKKVFEKLEELEHEIEDAVGTISAIVQESQLEEEHARVATYFSNLRTAALASTDISSGYEGAFSSFFSQDVVEVLDHINRDTQEIHDTLIGGAAVSQSYLELVIDNLYRDNAEMYTFNTKLTAIGTLYLNDLIHATLVLQCIGANATDPLHQAKAAELITNIGTYSSEISTKIHAALRDVSTVANNSESVRFMLKNQGTGKVLGRYADQKSRSRSIITHFEMHDKGGGYYYLKVAGKDVGIDHYYGKSIKPVRKGDSDHPNHLWKFDPAPSNPTRFYRVVNKATGAALDHYYSKSIKGAANDEHPNHMWEVLAHEDGNTCCIVNCASGDLLGYDASHGHFDGYSASYAVNAGVYNSSFPVTTAWTNAVWNLVRQDESEFHNLVNLRSGDAVDHYDGESFRFVSSPSTHPNHLWKFEPTETSSEDGSKAYHFLRNKATSQVIDHYYGKSIEGAGDTNATGPHPNHVWMINTVD